MLLTPLISPQLSLDFLLSLVFLFYSYDFHIEVKVFLTRHELKRVFELIMKISRTAAREVSRRVLLHHVSPRQGFTLKLGLLSWSGVLLVLHSSRFNYVSPSIGFTKRILPSNVAHDVFWKGRKSKTAPTVTLERNLSFCNEGGFAHNSNRCCD